MDFIVDLPESQGNMVIWTVIDLSSKQAHFVACAGLLSTRNLAKLFITHVYFLHRVLWRIVSDLGVQFTVTFLAMVESSHGLSLMFHPATNGPRGPT